MFWGDIVPSLGRMSFKLQKKALTLGRLNSIDHARLVDSGLRRDRFSNFLQNPRSQSSPAASLVGYGDIFGLGKSFGQLSCLQFCQTIKHF